MKSFYDKRNDHETAEARMARLEAERNGLAEIVRLMASGHIWRGLNAALLWARRNPP